MNVKAQYILYSLLDFGLTWGGTAAVIVYNCITPDNSTGYKLTLGGITLIVALLLTAKAVFEKHYREKYDTLLQQLAEVSDPAVKSTISEKINQHKRKNDIYQRAMLLLPFAILYIVTWFGARSLASLSSTVGLILACMGAGSVFNVLKKPVGEKVSLNKMTNKAYKKAKKS